MGIKEDMSHRISVRSRRGGFPTVATWTCFAGDDGSIDPRFGSPGEFRLVFTGGSRAGQRTGCGADAAIELQRETPEFASSSSVTEVKEALMPLPIPWT
jgi:hypothetical protein